MSNVWISAVGLCGSSILGSLLGFFIKNLPHRWNDTILGFCAGVMLAASTVGLILPAFGQVGGIDALWVVLGVIGGGLFLNEHNNQRC